MNTLRASLTALLLLAVSAPSFAGIGDPGNPDGGGGLPGDGGDDPPPGLIDASAIITPFVVQLTPLLAAAVGFGLAVHAVRVGSGIMLRQMGLRPPLPRGFVPPATGNDDLDLARAEGYIKAQRRQAARDGARMFRDERRFNKQRRRSNSQRGGRNRR